MAQFCVEIADGDVERVIMDIRLILLIQITIQNYRWVQITQNL